ncbi:CoA-transferase [Amycolatopsis anabasis]|uniref:CoA-transferase n=1 Tax=Amycolatopsis anabasis TaxID=1840409 RepID=UPI001C551940|nr:CoA-transferase [Amycolatopsis anabasis]
MTPAFYDDVDHLVADVVRPGSQVHLAITPSRPNALIYALCRRFEGEASLTLSVGSVHSSAHAIALSGAARRVVTGFLGDTYPAPRPSRLYRDVLSGKPFEVEPCSLLSLVQRLRAAALGLPWTTTTSLAGSDLGREGAAVRATGDPDEPSKSLLLLRPLRPELTLVHGVCADRAGNVALTAPYGEGLWGALAARDGVAATVERVVDAGQLRGGPGTVVIPATRVRAICVAPFGAHPQSLRGNGIGGVTGYLDDYGFLADTASAMGSETEAELWYERWVRLAGGHAEYLKLLGLDRLRRLDLDRARRRVTVSALDPVGLDGPATRPETLTVLAARAIVRLVRERGYTTLLAGIGNAHLASWLAAEWLAAAGNPVRVCAELGFLGMRPKAGDVYLFSQLHADDCEALAGVEETLGGMIAGNPRALGVLGIGQVDARGNVNTSVLPGGRWMTGSGGANDVASSTDCLLVGTATRERYVAQVGFVTSPGTRVRAVVSQFGRFVRDRQSGLFRLASWLRPEPGALVGETIRSCTQWPFLPGEIAPEEPVGETELTALRRLDPQGIYR